MRKNLSYGIALSFGLILFASLHYMALATSDLNYQVYQRSNSEIHVLTISAKSKYNVSVEIASELTPITEFASKYNAVAAINGGYFDPQNGKTTSYIIQDSKLVADPRTNERLIDNPDLKPYLGKILNRGEFRRYQCDNVIRYDITLRHAAIPDNCILDDALGAGPQLLPLDTSEIEGFTAYQDGQLIRNAIGGDSPNARSAIAITEEGNIILAMVAQTASTNSGLSLSDLSTFLQELGAIKAINLDGGSSSSFYYQGNTYYGKLDKDGNQIQRPLKSVLIVK